MNKGGFREGAGRKPGWGPYGEPTKPIRVPVRLIPKIRKILENYKKIER